MSRNEMPRCFLASGSVRTRQKIQSPYWPSVVQVFWPLTTNSSPSRTAVVRSEARSEPASGSEKPCDHQMSRLAVFGRNRSLSSWEPNVAITGPTMEALNASGVGTHARCISSCQMWRRSGDQSRPPHSTGQCGTARPCSLRIRWLVTIWSLVSSRRSETASRMSCGTWVVKKVRISSRNAASSADSSSCIGSASWLRGRSRPARAPWRPRYRGVPSRVRPGYRRGREGGGALGLRLRAGHHVGAGPHDRDEDRDQRGQRGGRDQEPEAVRVAGLDGQAVGPGAGGDDAGQHRATERAADRADVGVHARGDAGLRLRDRVDDEVRHRREREAEGQAEHRRLDDDLPELVVQDGQAQRAQRGQRGAHDQDGLGAVRRGEPPGEEAGGEGGRGLRQQQQPGLGHGDAEAVAGELGRLQELGEEGEHRVHAHAEQQGHQVDGPHRRDPHHPHVDQRLGAAHLGEHPGRQQDGGDHEQAEHPSRAPAPDVTLAHGEQQRDEPPGEQQRAADVDPARRALGGLRHPDGRRDGGQRGHHHRQPEQPVVAQRVDERPGEHQAEAAADGEQGGGRADGAGDLLAGELVADDAERQRQHAAADALHGPRRDQDADARGQGRHQRADRERRQGEDEHPLLAHLVADAADDRGEDGGRQQVRREHPGHRGLVGVERGLDGRQDGVHHRLQQGEGGHPDAQHQEGHAVVGPAVGRGHGAACRVGEWCRGAPAPTRPGGRRFRVPRHTATAISSPSRAPCSRRRSSPDQNIPGS